MKLVQLVFYVFPVRPEIWASEQLSILCEGNNRLLIFPTKENVGCLSINQKGT